MTDEKKPDEKAPEAPKRSSSVQVRMLADHTEVDEDGETKKFYGCNTVQTFSRAKAESLVASGVADDNDAAVRYATAQAEKAKALAAK
jgi:hypothetical protein